MTSSELPRALSDRLDQARASAVETRNRTSPIPRWDRLLEDGIVVEPLLGVLADVLSRFERDSTIPYITHQALARRERRRQTLTPVVVLGRRCCDLVIEALSYRPDEVLPQDLVEGLWDLIDTNGPDRVHRTPHGLLPTYSTSAARRYIAAQLIWPDLGSSRRRQVHGPRACEGDLSYDHQRGFLRGLWQRLKHLDDPEDFPFLWPQSPYDGQLQTSADSDAERTWADRDQYSPYYPQRDRAHYPASQPGDADEDVPKSDESVPDDGDPEP